jgi:nucleoside-diphosphate-sugar epimerase
MKFLVAGGAGFIGFPIVRDLLDAGHQVVVLDKVCGDLQGLRTHPALRIITAGIEDAQAVREAMKNVDVVYHCAWSFATKPSEAFKIDIGGSINVLDAAVENKVKQFLFSSSSVVYGEPTRVPIDEEHPRLVLKSRDPLHAITKLVVEKLSELYCALYGLPFTIFILWWAYSDERIPGRTLRAVVDTALKGELLQVPEKAGGSVVYTGDIVEAFRLATLNEKAYGQVFNLASFYITWEELINQIIRLSGSKSKMEYVTPEKWAGPGFLTGLWDLNTQKVTQLLGYKPSERAKRVFEESLVKIIAAQRRS